MKSHDLANLLLKNENIDVSIHANNHTFDSFNARSGYEPMKVESVGERVVIGNFSQEWISKYGESFSR